MKKYFLLFIILLVLYPGIVFSDITQIGTTANNFLKINAPAKPAGLGESYIALSNDIHSIFYNPAGIGKLFTYEFSFTHIEWFQDIKYENINVAAPFLFGNLGLSLNYLSTSSMKKTIVSPASTSGYEVLYEFSPFSFFGSITYATEFSKNFYIGGNLKILDFSINPEEENGSAFSFIIDTGIIYDVPFLKGLSCGLVFKNLGPSTSFISESFTQPINIRGGIGFSNNLFSIEGDVEYYNDNDMNYFLGSELNLFDVLTLRGGYKGGVINQFTLGAGINYKQMSLDYAFIPYPDDLGLTHRITLTYKFGAPASELKTLIPVFSPNNDKYIDFTVFKPELKSENRVKTIDLTIYNSMNLPIKTFSFPYGNKLYWNGYNDMHTVVPDGEYFATIKVNYKNGIVSSSSNKVKVEVDNTPPDVSIDANPKLLKPGEITALKAPVYFSPFASDLHGIGKWMIIIKDYNNKIFKRFSGIGSPPSSIIWDGSDDTGLNYVKTGKIYSYTFYAWDKVGNWAKTKPKYVKVLLREITITLSADTLFDPGKADVKISVYKDIKKVADFIKRYKNNVSVVVEGHTDNIPVRRSIYKNNLELSQARAEAVVKFFVELFNMNPKIFKAIGKGDTEPVASNNTEEGRRKNRRVEIHIKAKEWR